MKRAHQLIEKLVDHRSASTVGPNGGMAASSGAIASEICDINDRIEAILSHRLDKRMDEMETALERLQDERRDRELAPGQMLDVVDEPRSSECALTIPEIRTLYGLFNQPRGDRAGAVS